MFEDSLVESSGRLAKRNPWTAAASFAAEIAFAVILVLFSLLYTEPLPTQKFMSMLEAPAPLPPAAAPRSVTRVVKAASEFDHGVLVVPREIPKTIAAIREADVAGDSRAIALGVSGSILSTSSDGRMADILRSTVASAPKIAVQKVRVSSGVAQGALLRQVSPQYPVLARQARIQGVVVLQAVIGRDGTVQKLSVISGHPLLTKAALDAVRQWVYRPYLLNGEPVEVETQVNVNFVLEQ